MASIDYSDSKKRLKEHLLGRFETEIDPYDNQIERVKIGSWHTVIELMLSYREMAINGAFSSGTGLFASKADKEARINHINWLNARHSALQEAWIEELGEYWYSHLYPD